MYTRSSETRGSLLVALIAGGIGVAGAASGCSSAFDSCESNKTCPADNGGGAAGENASAAAGASDAGEAGVAGEAGNAGTGGSAPIEVGGTAGVGMPPGGMGGVGGAVVVTPKCKADADCDDSLACDGAETCDNGVCKPGLAPCSNPDAVNCDVSCSELNKTFACAVQGKDADKDGHLSSKCAAKPGDDCDDSVATTHPGAPELCDRVDNNCNGKIDLADGLMVSGTPVAVGVAASTNRQDIQIAWAPDRAVYGAAWYDHDVYFETFDKTGAIQTAPERVSDPSNPGVPITGLATTFGGDRFGVTWVSGDGEMNLRPITSAGAMDTIIPVAATSEVDTQSVVRAPNGDWGVFWGSATTAVAAKRVSGGFADVSTVNLGLGALAGFGAVASGSEYVLFGQATGGASVNRMTPTFGGLGFLAVGDKLPVAGAGPKGIAVATHAQTGLPSHFYAFGSDGSKQCGPVELPMPFAASSIVATSNGYLVASQGAAVQEVFSDCKLGAFFLVDTALGYQTDVTITGGPSGYAVAWQAGAPMRRVFGPNFCD